MKCPKCDTDKILFQRDRIEGERKQVTVMFCDLENFTQVVEKLGPEDAYSTMDQVYEILVHKVHDYEGTVNEMTGDGIMAKAGLVKSRLLYEFRKTVANENVTLDQIFDKNMEGRWME